MMRLRLFFAVIAIIAGLAAVKVVPNPLIETSSAFNRDVTIGMTVVYTSLRVLKGVLTMAADANFSAGVAVVNFEGSPGQLVTPVIDTIERMANLVFALMIASGVLAVLIPVLGSWSAAAVAVAAGLLALWASGPAPGRLTFRVRATSRALLLIGLMGAVVIPGAYSISSLAGDEYVRSATAEQELQTLTAPFQQSQDSIVAKPNAVPAPEEPSPASADQNVWQYLTGQIGGLIGSIGTAGAEISESVRSFGAGTLEQVQSSIASVGSAIEQAERLLNLLVALAVAYILKLFVFPAVATIVVVIFGRVALGRTVLPAVTPQSQ